jgi:hypothetical protein
MWAPVPPQRMLAFHTTERSAQGRFCSLLHTDGPRPSGVSRSAGEAAFVKAGHARSSQREVGSKGVARDCRW